MKVIKTSLVVVCSIMLAFCLYFAVKEYKTYQIVDNNRKLTQNELSEFSSGNFHFETSYVLLHDSNSMNYTGTGEVSYLGIINAKGQLEKIFLLDEFYNAITYNQSEERLELFNVDGILLISSNKIEKIISPQEKLIKGYEYRLTFDFPNIGIHSYVDTNLINGEAAYPTVGYSDRINVQGIPFLIPVGVAYTHTIVRYS